MMNTAELKVSVINKITSLKDNYLLEQILSLLEFEMTEKVYNLSNEQIREVNAAKLDFKNGNYLSEDKANEEINEWLGK